jgi:GAF domain-containing protein
MEPIEETQQILDDLSRYGDEETARQLDVITRLVGAIVPECVGLSVSLLESGLTFTMAATSEEIAALDAVQYLDGGPCVDAVQGDEVVVTGSDGRADLDEDEWRLLAQATAAAGVRSTLSIPLKEGDRVTGGVNLYASTGDAFEGRVEAIAAAIGAVAEEAVRNADLSFSTRERARLGPTHLDEFDAVNRAVGAVAASRGVDVQAARTLLHGAALRAGLTEVQVARALTAFLTM